MIHKEVSQISRNHEKRVLPARVAKVKKRVKKIPGRPGAFLAGVIMAVLMITSLWPVMGCDDTPETSTSMETIATTSTTPQDRAARLAAQSQLRNAQMAQEAYYAENNEYASTTAELKTMDSRLSARVEVTGGSANGYEMKITASDNDQTVYIIRQTENRIERLDGEGNPW